MVIFVLQIALAFLGLVAVAFGGAIIGSPYGSYYGGYGYGGYASPIAYSAGYGYASPAVYSSAYASPYVSGYYGTGLGYYGGLGYLKK